MREQYLKIGSGSHQPFAHLLFFFIVWPFGAWLYCLRYVNERKSYAIFFLFSLLICWHMAPVSLSDMYDDFIGIYQRFQSTEITTDEMIRQIHAYFTFGREAPKEIYEIVIIWLVKQFSDNYHFYFLLCSIPVAYFQLKSLKLITDDNKFEAGTWMGLIVVFFFIFPRDIFTVQNPRFTTGFWLCIAYTLYYLCSNRKNVLFLLPILLAPLIHSALWLYAIVIVIYLLIPKNVTILKWCAICTLPLMFFTTDIFRQIDLSQFLPPSLYRWSTYHNTDEAYANLAGAGRSGFWWLGGSFALAKKIMYGVLLIYIIKYFKRVDEEINETSQRLYPFLLFFFFITNVLHSVPALGERYFCFTQIFVIFLWFKAVYPNHPKILLCLLGASSWSILARYGYILGGALSVNTHPDLFYSPLPYLLGKGLFW